MFPGGILYQGFLRAGLEVTVHRNLYVSEAATKSHCVNVLIPPAMLPNFLSLILFQTLDNITRFICY